MKGRQFINKEKYHNLCFNNFEKRNNCPCCYGGLYQIIGPVYIPAYYEYPVGKVNVDKEIANSLYLQKCKDCGLLYKSHTLTREALFKVYEGSEVKLNYKSDNKHILQKFDIIKKIVSTQERHILDIGCHTGNFLKMAEEEGFKTSGLECSGVISPEYNDFINEDYYEGFLEDIELPPNTFDVITAWDVFEHLYDVGKGLRSIHNSLKPGGYLFIETGSASSVPAKLKKPNNWWYVSGLGHFNFFDTASIKSVLERMDFKLISIDKVCHKYIGELSHIQVFKAIVRSLSFYCLPVKMYRYLSRVKDASEKAARMPWKDHIFVTAQKKG